MPQEAKQIAHMAVSMVTYFIKGGMSTCEPLQHNEHTMYTVHIISDGAGK